MVQLNYMVCYLDLLLLYVAENVNVLHLYYKVVNSEVHVTLIRHNKYIVNLDSVWKVIENCKNCVGSHYKILSNVFCSLGKAINQFYLIKTTYVNKSRRELCKFCLNAEIALVPTCPCWH